MQATPGGFHFLEVLSMHDFIELGRNQPVEVGNPSDKKGLNVTGGRIACIQHLFDKFANEILCVSFLFFLTRQFAVRQNLVQKALFLCFIRHGLNSQLSRRRLQRLNTGCPLFLAFTLLAGVVATFITRVEFFRELGLTFGVSDDILQQGVEFIVAIQLGQQIAEPLTRFEQLAKRVHLVNHGDRLKIINMAELQLHIEHVTGFRILVTFCQAIGDAIGNPRINRTQNIVKIIAVDFDELAIPNLRKRLFRLTGKIRHDPDDERQFLHQDRVADFHIIGDLDTRRPNPTQFMLYTFAHAEAPSCGLITW